VALVVAAVCWVIADNGRARRLAELIRAWRGDFTPTSIPGTPPPGRQALNW
jgi:hypothetical protein